MNPNSSRIPETSTAEGWVSGGAFLGSILSGTLLGYLADRWLGTDPWFVVVGIVVGSYSGFMRMWQLAKQIENPRVTSDRIANFPIANGLVGDKVETSEKVIQTGNEPDGK